VSLPDFAAGYQQEINARNSNTTWSFEELEIWHEAGRTDTLPDLAWTQKVTGEEVRTNEIVRRHKTRHYSFNNLLN
jgi:hypothetical protein